MPYGTRNIQAGLAYHLTQRGCNQQQIFLEDSDRRLYLRLLKDHQKPCGVDILAYCLMPNHVHLILRPAFDDSVSHFCRRVHGNFARFMNLKTGRSGHFWQGRYFACSLSQAHLLKALHYVEHNPVRAGLADTPANFPWSSAAAHLGAPDLSETLDLAFWNSQGGEEAWRALLATPEELLEERAIRACTFSGRALSKPATTAHTHNGTTAQAA